MADSGRAATALERLIAAPKGSKIYNAGEAFLLHVFWECPSEALAKQLLDALDSCAKATHRDTPCTVLYFFRIARNNQDLATSCPHSLGEHPQLRDAFKKLSVGIPESTVVADLQRRMVDPGLVLGKAPTDPLPVALKESWDPVILEFTEIYLDEESFMKHAGSRDYLAAYGTVVQPKMILKPPHTIRLGTPVASLVEKILDPMLHENVHEMPSSCFLFNTPQKLLLGNPVLFSLDVETHLSPEELSSSIRPSIEGEASTFVAFKHPLRHDSAFLRVLLGFPDTPSSNTLSKLKDLQAAKAEIHTSHTMTAEDTTGSLTEGLAAVGWDVKPNVTDRVGYVLHALAYELTPQSSAS